MDVISQTQQIRALVSLAGSDRKAAVLIGSVRGVEPKHTALVRARQGRAPSYPLKCYIDDLKAALDSADLLSPTWQSGLSVRNKDGLNRLNLFDINDVKSLVEDPLFSFPSESNLGARSKKEIQQHIVNLE